MQMIKRNRDYNRYNSKDLYNIKDLENLII